VRATAAHPGWAATNLQGRSENRLKDAAMALGNRVAAVSSAQGALPTLFAAVADVPGGSYAGPSGTLMRGTPTLAGRSPEASDAGLARQLWTASAELTGVDFPAQLTV
jgi:hypothetical protein